MLGLLVVLYSSLHTLVLASAWQHHEKQSRWYFGGLAAAGAACFTHPLDLLKVQMQTQKGKNISLMQLTKQVVQNQGILGLYNGISASVLRQLTYSTVRFAIYEAGKQGLAPKDGGLSFLMSTLLAAVGGFAGGFVGSPADLVNVRMQNDIKLPPAQKRNYKNALHGFYRVSRDEGIRRMWAGASMTCVRAALMTIGQIAFYDLMKAVLISSSYFEDNVYTHVSASAVAGGIATALTQPVDVLKTRAMSASPTEFKGITNLIMSTAKEGPLTFFKGFIPAFVRIAPHTILTFVFLEQLRMNFGYYKTDKI